MTSKKLFNVIIPTRERADTLIHSLNTVLSQQYEHLNIIVSDNFSQDNTREVVASVADNRVRYVNTGRRVSMSHNWEFALSHVTDGYVFFLGDDDGLLPNAIATANRLLARVKVDAVTWQKARYMWPSFIHQGSQNTFWVTLDNRVEMRNSKEVFARIRSFDLNLDYEHLPCLYNSFVSMAAINKARGRTGAFFYSSIPDVYSAIALSSSVGDYVYSYSPLSINGASGHSNGTSYFTDSKLKAASQFLSEENIPFHNDLLLAPSIPILVAESILQARDNVPSCEGYDIDLETLSAEACRLSAALPEEGRRLVNASLEKISISRGAAKPRAVIRADLVAAVEGSSHDNSMLRKLRRSILSFRNRLGSHERRFLSGEVRNVHEASIYCGKLLAKRRWVILRKALEAISQTASRRIGKS